MAAFNPMSMRVAAFKAPSARELAHDFLWRIHRAAPSAARSAIFNRSHYEDVLVVRVEELAPEEVWRPRYEIINGWEAGLEHEGTTVLKIFLHISKEEQAKRFARARQGPAQELEVQPGRHREAQDVGRVHGGLRRGASPDQHQARALAHRPGRPQVGAQRGRHRAA